MPLPLEITFVFRKRTTATFSIEKLFDVLSAHLRSVGVIVRVIEVPFVSSGIISVLRNAWFVRRQTKTPLIHITGDVHYAALLCRNARTIVTIHDCVVLQRGTGLKRFVLWALWFWLPIRAASAMTVISDQTKRELLDTTWTPESRISVIPNFVDPRFAFSERPFAAGRPSILHIGTTPNKNLPRVVQALRGIPCVLVIVGILSPDIARDLDTNFIQYENHVDIDDDSIGSLYRDADIISFPSTYEGFGLPILEGQASGRPILTSAVEPMCSVAGAGGALVVDPYSVEQIRAGFLAIMHDDVLRSQLVAAGRQNCAKYSLERIAARYLSLYQEVLES